MRAIIPNVKEKLLLGAGLDVLHFESQEWLDTLDLWKDEVRFFDIFLKKIEIWGDTKKNFSNMLKSLDKIHADLFKDMEDAILEHEHLLSRLVKGEKGLADADYRDKHRILTARMDTFTSDFKSFKKIVFDYLKDFI